MGDLDNATKLKLESLLGMRSGFVLDFSDATFADFVRTSIGFDPYEKYPSDLSKARRLRQIWQEESTESCHKLSRDLLEHWRVSKQLAGETPSAREQTLHDELAAAFPVAEAGRTPVAFTTQATVSGSRIEIEIHDDIYAHIEPFLAAGDYFHAVEESYKVVRERLRELTSKEKATDVFNQASHGFEQYYEVLFGKANPLNDAEKDFFRGAGYLHLAVQFLRNEKAHSLAAPLEPNLALHYISLASLAYDLVTRYVSDEMIAEVEGLVRAKWSSYRTASAFYVDFEGGRWLKGLTLPISMRSAALRRALKDKWLSEVDFARSWDHSNFVLMRLQLIADELTAADIDRLLDLPTRDKHGNDQLAGMAQFLEFIEQGRPGMVSQKAKDWLADHPS